MTTKHWHYSVPFALAFMALLSGAHGCGANMSGTGTGTGTGTSTTTSTTTTKTQQGIGTTPASNAGGQAAGGSPVLRDGAPQPDPQVPVTSRIPARPARPPTIYWNTPTPPSAPAPSSTSRPWRGPPARRPPGPVSLPRDVARPRANDPAPVPDGKEARRAPAAPPLAYDPLYPRDCADVQLGGRGRGGAAGGSTVVYRPGCLKPAACAINVTCDFATDGGGWTVFQQRLDDSVDFAQDWRAYRQGFGNSANFWLGNEYLHELTSMSGRSYQLLVQLNDFAGRSSFGLYDTMVIAAEGDSYALSLGTMLGGDEDNFAPYNNQAFSTPDQRQSCATQRQSGWWHHAGANGACPGFVGDLNAPYDPPAGVGLPDGRYNAGLRLGGIRWSTGKHGVVRVRSVQMKMRPKEFDQPQPVWRINQSMDRWRRKQILNDIYEYEYPD